MKGFGGLPETANGRRPHAGRARRCSSRGLPSNFLPDPLRGPGLAHRRIYSYYYYYLVCFLGFFWFFLGPGQVFFLIFFSRELRGWVGLFRLESLLLFLLLLLFLGLNSLTGGVSADDIVENVDRGRPSRLSCKTS